MKDDSISRQEAIDKLNERQRKLIYCFGFENDMVKIMDIAKSIIIAMPSAEPEQRWIPCSERLPEDTDPVNITWTNRKPEPYYANIKNVPFVATGHYHNGKWWWYSATCQDYLDEYGESEVDQVDDEIEILAWMPLPKPYKEN